MNYLTIIAAVWAICAFCAVFFIRGATLRKPVRVHTNERELGVKRTKDFGRTV
jgi:hypothetical protein